MTEDEEEIIKRIKVKRKVWNAVASEAMMYKRDPAELVGSILHYHYASTLDNEGEDTEDEM